MLLILGIPGFLQAAFVSLPWSGLALAIFGSREHAHHGRGVIAILVPLAAFQIQLMIYGAMLFIAHIFNGGSPI